MSLVAPPKQEVLFPLLIKFIENRLGKTVNLISKPFVVSTSELIENFNEDTCALLLLERLLLENFRNNLFSQDLLNILLEVDSIPGYLFKFNSKPPIDTYPFFHISDELLFYPLAFENVGGLYIDLWKNNFDFCSTYLILTSGYDSRDLSEKVELADTLGFTRLGNKAYKDLEEILDLYQRKESEKILETLRSKESILVISEALSSPLEGVEPITAFRGSKLYFLIYDVSVKEHIFGLLSNLPFHSGSVDTESLHNSLFSDLDPFLLAYASLEHAKRAGKKHHHLDPFTLHVLADLFYEWDDYGSALKLYLRAKDYTLQPIELTLSLASIYYIFGDLPQAEIALRSKLCGCLKEDPRIHYNLGIIYSSLGKKEYAEYHFHKAFLLNKEERLFREQLIRYLWDEGKLDEIQEILKDIVELTPEEKAYLGKIAFLEGDYERAFNYLRDLLNYRDRDGLSLYFLAWLYMYFRMDPEVSEILLEEARNKLSEEEFKRLQEEFGLPR